MLVNMNRILLIHRGALGDFLLLLPALATVRRRFPEAWIEGLGHTEILSLACPGMLNSMASVESAVFLSCFEDIGNVSRRGADYLSSFDAVIAYVSDPERTLKRNLERFGVRHPLVCPPFPPAGKRVHAGRYVLEMIAPLLNECREANGLPKSSSSAKHLQPGDFCCSTAGCEPASLLRFEEEEIVQAKAFLHRNGRQRAPVVAIHPGSGSESKCWPMQRYELLAERLKSETDCDILLILGPADGRLVERGTRLVDTRGGTLARDLPLRSLAAVLSKCDACVGNDSGVTHLAAIAGIPTVAIFGPTDPAVWAPTGEHVRVVTGAAPCAPCTRETLQNCDVRECLLAIGIEDVLLAVCSLIAPTTKYPL